MSGSALVFGGRGMVGNAICKELVKRGRTVMSLGRSEGQGAGGPPAIDAEQRSGVDALLPETYESLLEGAYAVVVSIGEPPWIFDRERAIRANGLTNVAVLKAAAKANVKRVVLVNATMPSWGLIAGYREGKEMAEAEALRYTETCAAIGTGVLILKPGVVSGTRYAGRVALPMWIAFEALRFMMLFTFLGTMLHFLARMLPRMFGGVMAAPVRVEEIAKAAADAIEDGDFYGVQTMGVPELVSYKMLKKE